MLKCPICGNETFIQNVINRGWNNIQINNDGTPDVFLFDYYLTEELSGYKCKCCQKEFNLIKNKNDIFELIQIKDGKK